MYVLSVSLISALVYGLCVVRCMFLPMVGIEIKESTKILVFVSRAALQGGPGWSPYGHLCLRVPTLEQLTGCGGYGIRFVYY